jgi:Ca2+-binding EF-hand superfamily protein
VLSPGRYIIIPTAAAATATAATADTGTEDVHTDSNSSSSSSSTDGSDSDAPLPLLSPDSSAFTAAARAAISSIFDRLDADGDGVLSSKELSGFLRATEGVSLPAQALQFVQQHFDCREGGLTRLGLLQAYRCVL